MNYHYNLIRKAQCLLGKTLSKKSAKLVGLLVAASLSNSYSAAITGNLYNIDSAVSSAVNPTTSQWVTFTATEDSIVSQVQINNSNALTGSPLLDIGLYAVDGNGVPTGSALASSTLTPSGTGWQATALSYTLVKGTVYALKASTTTASTSYPWRTTTSTTINNFQPSGAPDSHWRRGLNSGTPVGTSQNVWILKTGANQAIGMPYTLTSYLNAAPVNAATGQRFRFDLPSTGESSLESVTLKLNISSTAPPANPLTVKLLDINGTVMTTGTLNLSTAAAGVAYFQINFDAASTLTAGEFYYLAVYSASSTSGSVTWASASTTADLLYESATYQGVDAYAVTWSSQSNFAATATTDLTRDLYFQLNLAAIPEPSTWALLTAGLALSLIIIRKRRQESN